METRKNRFSVVQLAQMSLLAALAYLLMFFPTIPLFAFFKLDFGDLPVLIGAALFGPVGGILIAVLKSGLYWMTSGASLANLIGVLASLTASIVIVLSMHWSQKRFSNQRLGSQIKVVGIETTCLVISLSILNWAVITPLYVSLMGIKIPNLAQYLLLQVIPFNLIKGIAVGTLFLLVQKRLANWIKMHK